MWARVAGWWRRLPAWRVRFRPDCPAPAPAARHPARDEWRIPALAAPPTNHDHRFLWLYFPYSPSVLSPDGGITLAVPTEEIQCNTWLRSRLFKSAHLAKLQLEASPQRVMI